MCVCLEYPAGGELKGVDWQFWRSLDIKDPFRFVESFCGGMFVAWKVVYMIQVDRRGKKRVCLELWPLDPPLPLPVTPTDILQRSRSPSLSRSRSFSPAALASIDEDTTL